VTNSRILSQEFEYFEPKTIDEAVLLLATYGEKAKIIAGGTDLLVQMKMDRIHPAYLINIARIPTLRFLSEGKGLRIGTLTPFREMEKSESIRKKYTALHEAAQSVSSAQIKNMGTVGGNLCHASPAADSAPPLLVLEATLKFVRRDGEKTVGLEDFFLDPGKTILSPRDLLVEVQVPEPPRNAGSAFLKMARVSADLAKVNGAVYVEKENGFCRECRIALGAVAKTPMRAREAESILRGKELQDDLIEKACQKASEEIQPITDIRSTHGYRRTVSRVLVRDAIGLAWERAGRH